MFVYSLNTQQFDVSLEFFSCFLMAGNRLGQALALSRGVL